MNWIEGFFLLATEAAEGHSGGFGLNLDILETNVINLGIVIFLLVYFGRGLLGDILSKRQSEIEAAIVDAESRLNKAAAALADQQQNLAQAQQEAERIKAAAEETAKAAKEAILKQAQQDVERMRAAAAQELSNEQEKIMTELRQRIVVLALQRAEAQLSERLDETTQQQLVDRSIAMIGG
jgi:F-type H+-transporting ATPase subunit b